MEILTEEQEQDFPIARFCHFCQKRFQFWDKKVRGHDHLAGRYRCPADSSCNLNYRINPKHIRIFCIIHKLRGYDYCLILSAAIPHY